jgi:molybdopterin-guanine dinucleotide biosynthesis protein A
MSLSVAITTGGKSTRMGRDKAFVELDGRPLIEHVIHRVSLLEPSEVILITNQAEPYQYLGLPTFPDILPDNGALGGLHSAIYHSTQDFVLVVACDMPFLNPDFLKSMQAQLDDCEALVPRKEGIPQCFHAFYNKSCLPVLERQIHLKQLKINKVYQQLKTRFLDAQEGLSFYNVNTLMELAMAQEIMSQSARFLSATQRPPASR